METPLVERIVSHTEWRLVYQDRDNPEDRGVYRVYHSESLARKMTSIHAQRHPRRRFECYEIEVTRTIKHWFSPD